MIEKTKLEKLYQNAINHQIIHDCSASPYESGERLVEFVERYQPERVLEIGTGCGYSAVLMALASPQSEILTIEKSNEHVLTAEQFLLANNVSDRVTVVNDSAELLLPKLKQQFDFIFFDGFQIHYQFIFEYEKLLKKGGILFLANNHLKSRTSDMFFEDLQDKRYWKILEQFAETTIVERS